MQVWRHYGRGSVEPNSEESEDEVQKFRRFKLLPGAHQGRLNAHRGIRLYWPCLLCWYLSR